MFLIGVGCAKKTSNVPDLELQQEGRVSTYRAECQKEWKEKTEQVNKIVQNTPNITTEQAQNLARNAGITDENNYVIDDDIWVKDCIDEKAAIFER